MDKHSETAIKSHKKLVDDRTNTLPAKFQSTYQKATSKSCSSKVAIRAKCAECMGYERVFERVRDCQIVTCPLWRYRPYQRKQKRYGSKTGNTGAK